MMMVGLSSIDLLARLRRLPSHAHERKKSSADFSTFVHPTHVLHFFLDLTIPIPEYPTKALPLYILRLLVPCHLILLLIPCDVLPPRQGMFGLHHREVPHPNPRFVALEEITLGSHATTSLMCRNEVDT